MKKIFILNFLIVLGTNLSFSQWTSKTDIPNPGDYLRADSAQKFVGTWIWTNNNDTVRFVFKKEKVYTGKWYSDRLYAFHQYIKNGVIIESSLSDSSRTYNQGRWTFLGNVKRGCTKCDTVSGSLTDITLNKVLVTTFILSPNRNQLSFFTKDVEIVMSRFFTPGFTLPRGIIFTKQ